MKQIVTVRDADSIAIGQWTGGDNQTLPPRAGYTQVAILENEEQQYAGMRWLGGTSFEAVTPVIRKLSPLDFVRRFTVTEEKTIRRLAKSNEDVELAINRLALVKESVDLDHLDVLTYLGLMKRVSLDPNTPANLRVWPDAATADTRIAVIRA